MTIFEHAQHTAEWWALKVGKISGTRFGQCISNTKNRLIYDLLNEILDGCIVLDDFASEDMIFGTDNEPIARQMYIAQSGIQFDEVGAILSATSAIHMASPDGLSRSRTKVLEIKCTQNGAIHLQRFVEGAEKKYEGQIINYFAVDDDVEEVHWVSYCPFRPEKPLVVRIYNRYEFAKEIELGRSKINKIETQLNELQQLFIF
jgi:hypothetical protein